MSEQDRESVLRVSAGDAGEPGEAITQGARDEIALILIDAWERAERYQPGSEAEIVSLHKRIEAEEVCHDVMVAPTGAIIIMVMKLGGFDTSVFPLYNHSLIFWDPRRKLWVLEKYSSLLKKAMLERQLAISSDPEAILAAICSIRADVKLFGGLAGALKEARAYAKLGAALVFALKTLPEARTAFTAIPELYTLAPVLDEMFAYAEQVVMTELPAIYDLLNQIRENTKQN
jgi:hypothetical protein